MRILAIRLGSLGDVVQAVPAVRALRLAWPRARIGWAVEERYAGLVRLLPCVDEVVVFERERGLPGVVSVLRRLREVRWDVALDLHGNLRSGVVTRASGAPLRVGFPRGRGAREGNWLFTNRRPPMPAWARHKVDRGLSRLAALGLEVDTLDRVPRLEAPAGPTARELAAEGEGPVVVVHPAVSAFGAIKRWPPERFGEVIRLLGTRAVVTHGPGERAVAEAVAAASGGRAAVAPRAAGLGALAALLAGGDLVLGCDTGPVHLAAALGVATVTVFGPKDPETYAPRGPGPHRVVHADVPCRPCARRRCYDTICTSMVSPRAVAVACRALL
ncbi:MAG: glycosyltransferase family 9 protein [Planctomycetes bacterium]|nr:glycosyltransferase family 9 protein [Planctomycetota bacterium]